MIETFQIALICAYCSGSFYDRNLGTAAKVYKIVPMFKNGMHPIHPGEALLEDYIEPMGLTVRAVAAALGITYQALREIVDGRRGITPEVADRIQNQFGGDAQDWLTLQAAYDARSVILEQTDAPT
jgi:addiction module HigA family antidote